MTHHFRLSRSYLLMAAMAGASLVLLTLPVCAEQGAHPILPPATQNDLYLPQRDKPLPAFHQRVIKEIQLHRLVNKTRSLPDELQPTWKRISPTQKLTF